MFLAFFIGFGFGGNFVLFARETAHVFGVGNLGIVYPYVFIGYAIAGIAGPFAGGAIYDITGEYASAITLSSVMSLSGSIMFLYQYLINQKSAK
jgi:OFA family oxalate/formate antiporter-like MFS transporter